MSANPMADRLDQYDRDRDPFLPPAPAPVPCKVCGHDVLSHFYADPPRCVECSSQRCEERRG